MPVKSSALSSDKSPIISMVFPIFSNASELPALFQALDAFCKSTTASGVELDIIFVNDGSSDNSEDLIRGYVAGHKNARLINLTRNFGTIAACKAALSHIKGDAVTYVSADLQDPLEQVAAMISAWRNGARLVISQRISRHDSQSEKSFAGLYLFLMRRLALPRYPKGGFDLFLADKSLFSALGQIPKNVNTQTFLIWLGVEAVILDYERKPRTTGRSGWTFAKKYNLFANNIFTISPGPIRAATLVGGAISVAGFLAASLYSFTSGVSGAAVVAIFISILSIVGFAVLFILGEYVWRILDLVNGAPETVIAEIIDHVE